MDRRMFLGGMLMAGGSGLLRGSRVFGAAAGWSAYSSIAIAAGAERCAIIGQDGTFWACSHSDKTKQNYTMAVRDVKQLIKDTLAKVSSGEMHFDGSKFTYTTIMQDALIGKKAEYACAVQATAKTIVVVIVRESPKRAFECLTPTVSALQKVGM